MESSASKKLMGEYIKRFDRTIFLRLKYFGFGRFVIKNNRFKQRSYKSVLINVFILFVTNIGASILLSATATHDLKFPEILTVAHFVAYANLYLINSNFFNRKSGYDIITRCIDLDLFLGAEETSFMRDVAMRNLAASCVLVAITSLGVVSYMYYIFIVSIKVHIIGSLYFIWLFCVYDDYCFYLWVIGLLSMRVRYLNLAIMKLSSVNTEYVPGYVLFYILYWRKQFDDNVTFHRRSGQKDFTQAFKMLFHLFDQVIQAYKFAFMLGVWTVVMGTFVSVQAFIIYIKASRVDILRASVVTGWAIGTWLFALWNGQLTDMFAQQIEQTVLICSYIQLKPTVTPDIHKLTKAVLRTLEVRNSRGSGAHGMFYFDTGLVFRIAASTFVYITVQLQMAFPTVDKPQHTNNTTLSAFP